MKLFFAALWVAIAGAEKLPEGPAKAIVEKVCGDCHTPDVVIGMRNDRAGWKDLVDEMVVKGAVAKERELKEIVDYLAKNFPKTAR